MTDTRTSEEKFLDSMLDRVTNGLGVQAYTTFDSGRIVGTGSSQPLSAKACKLVRFKADPENVGTIFIGSIAGGASTTDFPVFPGEDTGWIPLANLNMLAVFAETAGDKLFYIVLE